jgi:hypothetical protein
MTPPGFTVDDIKYADSPDLFKRAEDLFKSGKVKKLTEFSRGYDAQVQGTNLYDVSISRKSIDKGYCSCPMGERDFLCKHMLAVGLAVLAATGGLKEQKHQKQHLSSLADVKRSVSEGMRKLGSYSGPSSTWWSYQRKLATGSGIITDAIEGLEPSPKHAEYLWSLVLRISNKLATTGIDDSDGTVGDCVYSIIEKLAEFGTQMPELKPLLKSFCKDDTGFGFEDELRKSL